MAEKAHKIKLPNGVVLEFSAVGTDFQIYASVQPADSHPSGKGWRSGGSASEDFMLALYVELGKALGRLPEVP